MAFTSEDFFFEGADGKQAAVSFWKPSGKKIRGIIQISHGMCEHIGRYEAFAEYMTDHGFVVCGEDHIGHGRTADTKDDLGYFGENNGKFYLLENTHRLYELMRERFGFQLPYFLFGHSMGSFISRLYVARYQDPLNGCILSGSAGPSPIYAAGVKLAEWEVRRYGARYRSERLSKMAFGNFNTRYGNRRTSFDWLTRDRAIVDAYIQSPYCNFVFTASGFRTLFILMRDMSSREWFTAMPKKLPVLMLTGDMDPVGDYGKGVRKVCERLGKAGVQDIKLKVYGGARHELLNELNREEVESDILEWIQSHLPDSQS
ncbi:MAG TPA: alpha/beta hydrolase [Firmicutes bacterium]|nr:alpha/beta hydrolase [Bacillota bacterium]